MNSKKRHEETLEMIALYKEGWSMAAIGRKYGMTRAGVRFRLVAYGVPLRSQGK